MHSRRSTDRHEQRLSHFNRRNGAPANVAVLEALLVRPLLCLLADCSRLGFDDCSTFLARAEPNRGLYPTAGHLVHGLSLHSNPDFSPTPMACTRLCDPWLDTLVRVNYSGPRLFHCAGWSLSAGVCLLAFPVEPCRCHSLVAALPLQPTPESAKCGRGSCLFYARQWDHRNRLDALYRGNVLLHEQTGAFD